MLAGKRVDPVDAHVGHRVRVRRLSLGVSQMALADRLGLTFQQVQKYERGLNRISASKLYRIAETLSTPVAFFFEGLPDPASGASELQAAANLRTNALFAVTGGAELADGYLCLKPLIRRRLVNLVRTLARLDCEPSG